MSALRRRANPTNLPAVRVRNRSSSGKLRFIYQPWRVKEYICGLPGEYRRVYLDDQNELNRDLRNQIKQLRAEIREEVKEALREERESSTDSRGGSIRVDIGRGDLSDTEPSSVVAKDLVRLIRDNVRSSLVEKGQRAVDDFVSGMPEGTAADVLKSLANVERIRIVKLLYSSDRTFSEMKASTNLEGASVSHHLKSLLRMGLVAHADEGGYQLTKRGRLLVRTLALMNEALGGESVD